MSRLRMVLLTILLLLAACVIAMVIRPVRHAVISRLPVSWTMLVETRLSGIVVDRSLRLNMRDGRRLATTLYLPGKEPRPLATVLIRLPYGRDEFNSAVSAALFFAHNGYAVVVQDLRGTGDSEGTLLPWRDVADDGVSTLDWISKQSWSNGKVGTFGCSALGETQFVLAAKGHPAHAALLASGAGGAIGKLRGRFGYFGLFEGGAFELASGFGWFAQYGAKDPAAAPTRPFEVAAMLEQLPVRDLVTRVRPDATAFTDYLDTPLGDPQWEQWGFLSDSDRIDAPVFSINTWYDQTVGDALVIAEHVRASGKSGSEQRVVIGPGGHCDHETVDFPPLGGPVVGIQAAQNYRQWYLQWFDFWLRGRGAGLSGQAPFTYYMLGENKWYGSMHWPPEDARERRWHLDSNGNANSRSGDGRLVADPPARSAIDSYDYDPRNPVPTRGGAACCTGDPAFESGQAEQGDVESRPDVLVYTTEPLASPVLIAGPLKAVLTVSSDVLDTDLVARLVDVGPDGRALNIQEGALRLRYREGAVPRLLVPGERVSAEIDMRSIAYRVATGHRLRLDVTSSSFPRLDRNLNTGKDNARETNSRVARVSIHHGESTPAYLELFVLPSADIAN